MKMGSVVYLYLWMVALVFCDTIRSSSAQGEGCGITSCGELSIDFPFSLKGESSNNDGFGCGYPGFELSCNNKSEALISVGVGAQSGDFLVTRISLENQQAAINDPHGCLPRRILDNFTLALHDSPFQLDDSFYSLNYSFLNCPSNLTSASSYPIISCLASSNHSVIAVLSNPPFSIPWISSCRLISTAMVPVTFTRLFWNNYDDDILLRWTDPDCGYCAQQGGRCGFFLGASGPYVACYDLPNNQSQGSGVSKRAKYGVAFGLGTPAFLGATVLAWMIWRKMKRQDEQRGEAHAEFSTSVIPHPSVVVMGLDGASIDKYPKTQVGESGRLPNPNDNVCSICLSDYQPKDTLRTIPHCNHYFHAACIDGWLRMNAACPLCRKLLHSPTPPAFNASNFPHPPPISSL